METARRAHVIPLNDLVGHEATEECVCMPTPDPVFLDDGSNGWIYVHHALDGRDTGERERHRKKTRMEIQNGER